MPNASARSLRPTRVVVAHLHAVRVVVATVGSCSSLAHREAVAAQVVGLVEIVRAVLDISTVH